MSQSNLPLNASAVLVWMQPGQTPSAAAFDPNNVQTPPVPNPEAWWLFGECVEHACSMIVHGQNHGKDPWIKVGTALFDPAQIKALCKTFKALRDKT